MRTRETQFCALAPQSPGNPPNDGPRIRPRNEAVARGLCSPINAFRCGPALQDLSPHVSSGWSDMALLSPTPLNAQVTESDYNRAEQFLGWNASTLVHGDRVQPVFFDGAASDRFWYLNRLGEGSEFVLVDPSVREPNSAAFDHDRLAGALSTGGRHHLRGPQAPVPDRFEFVERRGEPSSFTRPTPSGGPVPSPDYACAGPDERAGRSRTQRSSRQTEQWVAYHEDEDLWIRPADGGEACPTLDRRIARTSAMLHLPRDVAAT